jgi:hypothetical protein
MLTWVKWLEQAWQTAILSRLVALMQPKSQLAMYPLWYDFLVVQYKIFYAFLFSSDKRNLGTRGSC